MLLREGPFPAVVKGSGRELLDWSSSLDCIRKGLRTLGSSSHPASIENRQTDFDEWAPAVTGNHIPCCSPTVKDVQCYTVDTLYLGEGKSIKKKKNVF